eukprot:gnl/TRDRNA2_/TRDRNA2_174662_c13_seq1.p1 gnl/TRDRNA2_/TRDRNA2_174662_c13~~gnl/TRDRNA2_/TRDRNA2_174662_c13_seq1.p1  ORF type:complete len:194 (-),score=64.34 gnl/TRDRNA2_/TRDRNA2_174662_c13_seq1:274-855(-)
MARQQIAFCVVLVLIACGLQGCEMADKAKEALSGAKKAASDAKEKAKGHLEDAKKAASDAAEKAKGHLDHAKKEASDAAEKAHKAASEAAEHGKAKADEAKEAASKAASDAADSAKDAMDTEKKYDADMLNIQSSQESIFWMTAAGTAAGVFLTATVFLLAYVRSTRPHGSSVSQPEEHELLNRSDGEDGSLP